MSGRVGIVGIGHTPFGRRSDATVQELAAEAFRAALADSGLDRGHMDAVVVGSVPEYHKQRSLPGVVQEYLGLTPKPTWLTEAACASGSAAIRTAWMSIKAGVHDVVAVIGCQKMTELETAEILALMGRVGEVQWESSFGSTFPGYYAMFARRHMHEYGTTREQLTAVAIKNHFYGARNPLAMFRKEITAEKANASEDVATPFHVFDCCANADGAACVILAAEPRARGLRKPPVWLSGMGCASDTMSVLRRPSLTGLGSAQAAAAQAYAMAGVDAKRVRVADVHDCFTIAEVLAYEDLGFCAKGEGGAFIAENRSYIGGSTPVNVDGGLKAKGHPIGATGVSMTTEIVKQLRGDAGERQVPDADVGLTHNVGGIGQYCFVQVLTRDE
ncbi:MAG: thiolase domain-containing protein [Candidatus Eisenbacteria bacterium]|uniref:Thiolase domain-containing protein n=1 Tax=Eiseniibacteriota bacterium TaxID=2212470 RepID=A0A933SCG3_UNCEI|nr:thiolase domain-containing protein [Candidatus Eisenbacteria bacterium]